MRSASGLVLIFLLAATAGCSLLFGIRAEDYTDGGGAAPSADSGGTDAGSADGGAPADADASADAARSPCVDTHLFCDDFDQPSTLEDRGWKLFLSNSGHVGVDNLDSRSAPKSLWAEMGPISFAAIERDFTKVDPNGDLRLRFDLRIESFSAPGTLVVLNVSTFLVRLVLERDGRFSADEFNTVDAGQAFHKVDAGSSNRWTNVEMAVRFVKNRQSGSRMKITIDGQIACDDPIAPTVDNGTPAIQLGIVDQPDAYIRLRVDNVTFDRSP